MIVLKLLPCSPLLTLLVQVTFRVNSFRLDGNPYFAWLTLSFVWEMFIKDIFVVMVVSRMWADVGGMQINIHIPFLRKWTGLHLGGFMVEMMMEVTLLMVLMILTFKTLDLYLQISIWPVYLQGILTLYKIPVSCISCVYLDVDTHLIGWYFQGC